MSIWHERPDPSALDALHENTAVASLGIRITAVEDDALIGTMPVDARTVQPFGLLHGGANVLLAETLGSAASNFCIDQQTHVAVGVEVNANHVGGARDGEVTGVCRPLHLGRRLHVWEIRISQQERLLCAARLTMSVIDRSTAR